MNTEVRPLTFGETLDRIWRILRQRVMLFAAIGMVPLGVLVLCVGAMFGILYALGDFPQPQTAQAPAKAHRLRAWRRLPRARLTAPRVSARTAPTPHRLKRAALAADIKA
jgi:hypothetical protein